MGAMNNKQLPFFSVVIPVYNSERYLNECLESVFAQSCGDFELILVDDESRDRSGVICEEWKKKYPEKVRVIHQDNTGVYIAKRNGIKASKGRFIYVMDNDDLIVSNRAFENIKKKIEETGCDIVVFNATDNIKTGHLLCSIPFKNNEVFEGNKLSIIYDSFLKTKNLHHIWMMVFNRDLFDWDYEYSEEFRMLRDGPSLILPIISSAKKIVYLEDVFYYWRVQNQNSASKHYDVVNFYKSIKCFHKRVFEYSKKWKYKSSKTESLVRSSYVVDICIAAIKARSIDPAASMSKSEYIHMLSNDEMFRAYYTTDNLEAYRKLIAFALYHRQIWLLSGLSTVVGLLKRR